MVTISRVAIGDIVWYFSARLGRSEYLSHANAMGGAVFRGHTGHVKAVGLRQSGFNGRLWLDPAAYEDRSSSSPPTLWDDWHQRQSELSVVEFISPGCYVGDSDLAALRQGLQVGRAWVDQFGGRISLALDASWLTTGLGTLIGEMQEIEHRYALAFSDRFDPLSRAGAVKGLVTLLGSVADIAVLRNDIGAIGASMHGAEFGAIGTSSGVRHVFPPGQRSGGGPTGPSVFLPTLMDYKLGTLLDELPSKASPRCYLDCCRGDVLRRFNTAAKMAEAIRHNRTAIGDVISNLLAVTPSARPRVFKQMCADAHAEIAKLSALANRPLAVRPQVKAWAELP